MKLRYGRFGRAVVFDSMRFITSPRWTPCYNLSWLLPWPRDQRDVPRHRRSPPQKVLHPPLLFSFSLSLFLSFFLSFFRSLKRERLPLDTRFHRSISRKVASLFDLRVHARIAVMRYKGTSFSENREFGINCSVIIRIEKRGLLEVRLKVRNDFQIIHESR